LDEVVWGMVISHWACGFRSFEEPISEDVLFQQQDCEILKSRKYFVKFCSFTWWQ